MSATLAQTIKTFGEGHERSRSLAAELEAWRAARRLAKARRLSDQLRTLERKADRQRQALEAARAPATVATDAVRDPQTALVGANADVVSAEFVLQEIESERKVLLDA